MPLPAQSLTEDAATSSGFFRRSMAGPAPRLPPSLPGGLAVKRGGSAALSRQCCEGGRCRHVGKVRGGPGGSARCGLAGAERSRPGLPRLWVIPALKLREKMSVSGGRGTNPPGLPLEMSLWAAGLELLLL